MYKKVIVGSIFLYFLLFPLFPEQTTGTKEQELTMGIGYNQFFQISENINENFSFFDISGVLTFPFPVINPLVSAGVFSILENTDSVYTWTHYNLYIKGGIQYIFSFNDYLHTGVQMSGGFSRAQLEFPAGNRNLYNILSDGGLFLAIDPFPGIRINLNTSWRYYHSLTLVKRFDGFHWAVGGDLRYRININPPPVKNELRIKEIITEPIFAALMNYYTDNQAGVLVLENASKEKLENIRITLSHTGYIDTPTPSRVIPALFPGETVTAHIFAVFNESLLSARGAQSFSGEIKVHYRVGLETKTITETALFHLYDKNSLIWDDNRKIASFINPLDNTVKKITADIRNRTRPFEFENFNEPLQMGILFYTTLSQLGCFYQPDPKIAPLYYKDGNAVVDTIHYPDETLQQLSGDCDDLTVLYLSLLERVGVETGFITTPGHILPVFNTGMEAHKYKLIHPEKDFFIIVKNSLWIPIEITGVGKENFLDAWQNGIGKWRSAKDHRMFFTTKSAQSMYKPVVSSPISTGSAYTLTIPPGEKFSHELNSLADLIINDHLRITGGSGNIKDYTNLGMIYACFNQYSMAEGAFLTALALDPGYVYAMYNLGSLFYIRKMYTAALNAYNQLLSVISTDDKFYKRLITQISNTYYKLNDFDNAAAYVRILSSLPGVSGEKTISTALEQGVSDYEFSFDFYFIAEY